MKKSYGEGIATHSVTESCGAACKGGAEALIRLPISRVTKVKTVSTGAKYATHPEMPSMDSLSRESLGYTVLFQ